MSCKHTRVLSVFMKHNDLASMRVEHLNLKKMAICHMSAHLVVMIQRSRFAVTADRLLTGSLSQMKR
jgi:hypothetical protein